MIALPTVDYRTGKRLLPTASALDRARLCPPSAVLPRVDIILDILTRGTTRHRFLERVNVVGRDQALQEIEDDISRAISAAINLEGLPLDPACYVPEIAYAWNWRTGEARELGRGLDRNYVDAGATEDDLCGTADVVALLGQDGVFIADWKGLHDTAVPPLRRNRQLRFLAFVACELYGRDRAVIEIIRYDDKAETAWRDRLELDAFDLLAIRADLLELVREVLTARAALDAFDGDSLRAMEAGQLVPVVGEHCRRCPAQRKCPAHQVLLAFFRGGDAEAITRKFDELLSEATVTELYHWWKAAEVAIERIGESLKMWATRSPIRIDDDHVFAVQTQHWVSLVGNPGFHVIKELAGEEEAWKTAALKISNDALDKLAGRLKQKAIEAGKKTTKKAIYEDIIARADRVRGVKRDVVDQVRRIKVKR